MKRFLLFALLIFTFHSADAQRDVFNWQFKGSGSLPVEDFESPETLTPFGLELGIQRRVGESWLLGLNYNRFNELSEFDRLRFASFSIAYLWDNDYLLPSNAFVVPYHRGDIGLGATGSNIETEEDVEMGILAVENGLKFRLGDRLSAQLGYAIYWNFNRDDVNEVGDADRFFNAYKLSLSYHFGLRESSYRGPVFNARMDYTSPTRAIQEDKAEEKRKAKEEEKKKEKQQKQTDSETEGPAVEKTVAMRPVLRLDTVVTVYTDTLIRKSIDTLRISQKELRKLSSDKYVSRMDTMLFTYTDMVITQKVDTITIERENGDYERVVQFTDTAFVEKQDTLIREVADTLRLDKKKLGDLDASLVATSTDTILVMRRDLFIQESMDSLASSTTRVQTQEPIYQERRKMLSSTDTAYLDQRAERLSTTTTTNLTTSRDTAQGNRVAKQQSRTQKAIISEEPSPEGEAYGDDRYAEALERQNEILENQNRLMEALLDERGTAKSAQPQEIVVEQPDYPDNDRDINVVPAVSLPIGGGRDRRADRREEELEDRVNYLENQLDSLIASRSSNFDTVPKESTSLQNAYEVPDLGLEIPEDRVDTSAIMGIDTLGTAENRLETDTFYLQNDTIAVTAGELDTFGDNTITLLQDLEPGGASETSPADTAIGGPVSQSAPTIPNTSMKTMEDEPLPERAETTTVFFGLNSKAVASEYHQSLDSIANHLKSHPEDGVYLTGYTDRSGNADYNLMLSKQRAQAVKAYLVNQGIEAGRVTIEGAGQQIAEEEYNQNARRVEISLIE